MADVASRWYGPDEHEPTMALCEHLARATYDDIPDESRAYATRSIMDSFGIALAGSDSPSVRMALGLVRDWAGKPEARLLVTGERVPAPNAALVNTAMARARLLDDMEEGVGDHPTVAPLHAAVAAAEMAGGCSGKQLITAVTLASDLILRIRYALHSETRAFAWCTESFAPLAAAVAVGKVWGFDANGFADALGIAYQQLSSTWLMHQEGASIHHLQHGLAAHNGLLSALFARGGIKGTRNMIEREYGMIHALGSTAYDRSILLDELGKHYRNVDITLKRYPAAGFTCFAIDGVRELLRRHALSAADVQSATVYVNERAYLRACQPEAIKRRPPSLVHAQMSIPYTVAATIVRGDFFLDELTPESLTDPAILSMAERVRCVVDPELDKLNTVVAPLKLELHLTNGETRGMRVDYPRGHARNPMTLDEIAEKFRRCAGYAEQPLDQASVEKAIAALRRLEAVSDIRDVMSLLTVKRKRAGTAPAKRRRTARK
ncbi:MAG: MmgE/PrpD family protein [Dehalococcoidia bacterium]|nr:MmgE/PrpD family protein [Dehalococcoidia bacterium]